jgi:hypothetical protein
MTSMLENGIITRWERGGGSYAHIKVRTLISHVPKDYVGALR